MPRYTFIIDAPSVWIAVEAQDEDEAYEKAQDIGDRAALRIVADPRTLPAGKASEDVVDFCDGGLDWGWVDISSDEDDEEERREHCDECGRDFPADERHWAEDGALLCPNCRDNKESA